MAIIREIYYENGEFGFSYSDAQLIQAGDIVFGTLETASDRDYIGIQLQAGQVYRVTMTADDVDFEPYFRLLEEGEGHIRWSFDTADNNRESMLLIAPETKTYYISPYFEDRNFGDYQITLEAMRNLREWSLDEIVDQLRVGFWQNAGEPVEQKWANGAGSSGPVITYNISELTPEAQILATLAFEEWERVANIEFIATEAVSQDIMFEDIYGGAYADSTYLGSEITSTFINVTERYEQEFPHLGAYTYYTFLHEIGHALGLGHGGNYNFSGDYAEDALYLNDNWETTIMSYFDAADLVYGGNPFAFPLTPMPADLLAIWDAYGAKEINTEDSTYTPMHVLGTHTDGALGRYNQIAAGDTSGRISDERTIYTLVDSGGTDHIDASASRIDATIDLRQGQKSHIELNPYAFIIMQGTVIENATGGIYNDTITGNAAANTLDGQAGDDLIFGGTGFDTLRGGDGDDVLDGGINADLLLGEAGNDTLRGAWGTDRLEGGAGDDELDGGSEADRLFGGDGDDLIRAGSNFGNSVDGVEGGAGNDTIYGDAGFDLLKGGLGDDVIYGGQQADDLRGEDGNDTLEGGAGFDRLFGGTGDDLITDFDGLGGYFGEAGNDTLQSGDAPNRFFGGAGNDLIEAGAGGDTISGGAGFDTIDAGTGNDLIFGDFNADTFVIANGHGRDIIGDFDALSALEVIDFSGLDALTALADLDLASETSGAATQDGADVLIDTGSGNAVRLRDVTLSDLDASDFIF